MAGTERSGFENSFGDLFAGASMILCPEYCDDEKALLKGLKSASGYLRHQLGQAIDLRYTPELQFFMDDSIAHGAHILDLLNHVKPANPANADIVLPEDRE